MRIEELQQNDYFGVVIDFAIENGMRQRRSPTRMLQDRYVMHSNTGNGYETQIAGAVYETNYAHGFYLTPSGALRILNGTPRENDIEELAHDLDVAADCGLFLPDVEAFAQYF